MQFSVFVCAFLKIQQNTKWNKIEARWSESILHYSKPNVTFQVFSVYVSVRSMPLDPGNRRQNDFTLFLLNFYVATFDWHTFDFTVEHNRKCKLEILLCNLSGFWRSIDTLLTIFQLLNIFFSILLHLLIFPFPNNGERSLKYQNDFCESTDVTERSKNCGKHSIISSTACIISLNVYFKIF